MKKSTDFNNFWCKTSWRNLTPENYTFTHLTYISCRHTTLQSVQLSASLFLSPFTLSSIYHDPQHQLFFCPIIDVIVHNLFPLFLGRPLCLASSSSKVTHFYFTQSSSSFLGTCPHHPNLFLCTTFRPTVFSIPNRCVNSMQDSLSRHTEVVIMSNIISRNCYDEMSLVCL